MSVPPVTMYSSEVGRHALDLIGRGISPRSISMSTGISRATLHDWREHPEGSIYRRVACPRCAANPTLPEPRAHAQDRAGTMAAHHCVEQSWPFLPAGSFIRTVIAGSTVYGHVLRTASAGTSIRDICSPMNPRTFFGCAARRSIGWGWPSASRGGTSYPWRGARRWRGLTSSWGRSTDADQTSPGLA